MGGRGAEGYNISFKVASSQVVKAIKISYHRGTGSLVELTGISELPRVRSELAS